MNLDPVGDNERLTRFIVSSGWVRKQDNYVKRAAFMPDADRELSVMRQLKISEDAVWDIGGAIARKRQRMLYDRADITAVDVRSKKLEVVPSPETDNPNHANIVNWPEEKEKQIVLALELSAHARFVPAPL